MKMWVPKWMMLYDKPRTDLEYIQVEVPDEPTFKPGDRVVRKDGLPLAVGFDGNDLYALDVATVGHGPDGDRLELKHDAAHSIYCLGNDVKLAPELPTPEQLGPYELTGEFRCSSTGEYFWHTKTGRHVCCYNQDCETGCHKPSYILRLKPEPKPPWTKSIIPLTVSDSMLYIRFRAQRGYGQPYRMGLRLGKDEAVTEWGHKLRCFADSLMEWADKHEGEE